LADELSAGALFVIGREKRIPALLRVPAAEADEVILLRGGQALD